MSTCLFYIVYYVVCNNFSMFIVKNELISELKLCWRAVVVLLGIKILIAKLIYTNYFKKLIKGGCNV